ncbi:hypothetical protein V6Z11_A04G106600 [Gossypium hirsutum]
MARYAYGLIFLAYNLLAWAVRDYRPNAFPEMERQFNYCFVSTLNCQNDGYLHNMFTM